MSLLCSLLLGKADRPTGGKIITCLICSVLGFVLLLRNSATAFPKVYNANLYSGLPSNHVYMALKDEYGYLWLATSKGLVRYNGYEFKQLSIDDDFLSRDIWGLKQDKRGKIWLYNFSTSIGYIYKSKYHQAYFADRPAGTIYPKSITDADDGIIFQLFPAGVAYEKNDTVRMVSNFRSSGSVTISNRAEIVLVDSVLHRVCVLKGGKLKSVLSSKSCKSNYRGRSVILAYNQYLMYRRDEYANCIGVEDVRRGNMSELCFSGKDKKPDSVIFIAHDNSFTKMSVVGMRNLYMVDSNLSMTSYSINELLGDSTIDGSKVTSFYFDSFWKRCVCTVSGGLYINYEEKDALKPAGIRNMEQFRLVGTSMGGSFWWDDYAKDLLLLDGAGKSVVTHHPEFVHVKKVHVYDDEQLLINGNRVFLSHSSKTERTTSYYSLFKKILPTTGLPAGIPNDVNAGTSINFLRMSDTEFYVSMTNSLLTRFVVVDDTVLTSRVIANDRLPGFCYDSTRSILFAYNEAKLIMVLNGRVLAELDKYRLSLFGLHKIESMQVDQRTGNIYVKDVDKIVIVDPGAMYCRQLGRNFNMMAAQMHLSGNKLSVCGRFGILFYSIDTPGRMLGPVYYPNIKDRLYVSCTDCYASGRTLFVNTDRGLYTAKIPSEDAFRNAGATDFFQYSFILEYQDDLKVIQSGDTVYIDQQDYKLQFDLVRPTGNGVVKYAYSFGGKDSDWHTLSGNEWNAAHLKPGVFHDLLLKASDYAWVSDPVRLRVMVRPYWWQTDTGRRGIIAGTISMIAVLTLSSIFLTRRILIKRNQKRTELLELELKSIHAQINPHFIFNTLNSALHFIKMNKADAAYKHITKFSRLLRSYLKSSRYRYISLADEIENLKYYIELQQTRFSFAFSYHIELINIQDASTLQIPSLLLQPIVENAINHGLLPLEDRDGKLFITFSRSGPDATLHCRIEDNGIGRRRAKMARKENTLKDESFGDQLLKDLIGIFNRYEKMGIEMNYIDKDYPETGTIVNIIIKNPHYR